MVGTTEAMELRVESRRPKKNVVTIIPRSTQRSATEWAIAVFPEPAAPFIHIIFSALGRSAARLMLLIKVSNKVSLVPEWQPVSNGTPADS